MVQDHLAQGLQIAGLLDLEFVGLRQALQFFILFFYYLLVLKLYQLSLLLEVLHDLPEAGLEEVDLRLQLFDLGILPVLFESYFLIHLQLLLQLRLQLLVQFGVALRLLLHVLELVFLQLGLVVKRG